MSAIGLWLGANLSGFDSLVDVANETIADREREGAPAGMVAEWRRQLHAAITSADRQAVVDVTTWADLYQDAPGPRPGSVAAAPDTATGLVEAGVEAGTAAGAEAAKRLADGGSQLLRGAASGLPWWVWAALAGYAGLQVALVWVQWRRGA